MLDYEGVEAPDTAVPRAALYMRGLLHLLQRRQLLSAGTVESSPSPEPTTDAADAGQTPSTVDERESQEISISG